VSPPKNVKWIADVPFDEINHNKRWQNPSLCFLKKQNRVEKTKTKLVFTPHVKTPFYTPLVKTPHFFLQILVKTCFVKITYANVRKIKKSKNKTELKRQNKTCLPGRTWSLVTERWRRRRTFSFRLWSPTCQRSL